MKQEFVQDLFASAVEMFADLTAIEGAAVRLTYNELNAKANRFANFLAGSGAANGSVVAIMADDTAEVIATILGVLKAGCVFVPLDPKIPQKRLATMMAMISPSWFVTESKYLNSIATDCLANAKVVCVESITSGFDAPTPPVTHLPDDMCYIYFTSGSTGVPKAIAGRLKGIDHFIRWEIETLKLDPGVRVSQFLPLSFDGSLRDIFVPLCAGGTICLPESRELLVDAQRLGHWIDEQQINVIHCVPSLFRSILNEKLDHTRFASLRYVLMAGEPLLPSDVGRWLDLYGDRTQLINLYGTSETTMAKFFYFVKPEDRHLRSIPVGKPMEGARAVVVDAKGKPCPAGMIGEIYIRTPYRSLGYYKQPELTAEVFVQNPFSDDPNDIVYKTGDLGRVLKSGDFEYLGRQDQQVKIRGVRVELAEIENLLRTHSAVKDVAAIDRADSAGHNYLCAYVVLETGAGTDELRELLAQNLPEYMVPSAFVVMEVLPRTISGKVDRRALPAPGDVLAARQKEYVAPRTPVEEVLVGVWAKVLGLEQQVGIHDNFFQLGGHSLLAMQLLSRVRDALQVELPLRSLFESPTVAELSAHVEAAMRNASAIQLPALKRVSREGPLPVSYAQQRLWFMDQLEPGSAVYNIPIAMRMTGELDVRALERTLSELIRRHEVLRTTFTSIDGEPVQVIGEAQEVTLPVIDLEETDEVAAEVARLATEEAQRPFDLSRGPLLRASLLRLREQEHVVLLTMHHIISDGWSIGVMVQEVGALYEAYTRGAASPLAELPVQYADYAAWQREWLQGEVLERQLNYWREQLGGAPVLELPTDHSRPAVQTFRGASQPLSLSKELSESIKQMSQREGVTVFMTLLAAFDVLLAHHSGQDDIVVGTDIANRNRSETEGLIGFFVNQLVLRTDLSGDPGFRELLQRVREVTVGAYGNQDVPFSKLVEVLKPERNLSRNPLFQVLFVLHDEPAFEFSEGTEFAGPVMRPLRVAEETAKFDCSFHVWDSAEGFGGVFKYRSDLFDASTFIRIANGLEKVLGQVLASPDTKLSELKALLAKVDRKEQSIRENKLKQARLQKFQSLQRRVVAHESAGTNP
jgi:amino acid adenylation domain-containing protein